jgi:hypothetical protein
MTLNHRERTPATAVTAAVRDWFRRAAASVADARIDRIEWRLFLAATGLILIHIIDAEFVQPQPGTSAGDHLTAGLIPCAVALAVLATYRHLRPGLRAGTALVFGVLAVVAGAIALGGARAEGVSGSEWTGLLLLFSGPLLIGLGCWVPWRERGRWASTRGRLWRNRAIAIVTGALLLFFVVVPIGAALWTTQKFRTSIGVFALPHESVRFRTADGLQLSGWYVPSRNGAAIVLVHGGGGSREGAIGHAEMLASAGYGVLLYDARGRGESEGAPDAYGWTWGRDVDAAVSWLQHRPDVDGNRVGALGLSTGADVLVEVAARNRGIRAVVADGSTTRSLADLIHISHGLGDWLSVPFFWTQYAAAEVFEDARPGPPLEDLAKEVPPTRILFIASKWPIERQAAPVYAQAAGQPRDLWLVDAGHTHGFKEHPQQYATRVITFFDQALGQNQ